MAINNKDKRPICGIVMPISAMDNCTKGHWKEVLAILKEVATNEGFEVKMVSDSDDVGVIHKRIITNLYKNDIIICDVSCNNPNVMFELGMRLTFDKAVILIKDDITKFSFDTNIIEHLEYSRNFRYASVQEFKKRLGKKLTATYKKSKEKDFSQFLGNFGTYKVGGLNESEITKNEYLLKRLDDIESKIDSEKEPFNPMGSDWDLMSGTTTGKITDKEQLKVRIKIELDKFCNAHEIKDKHTFLKLSRSIHDDLAEDLIQTYNFFYDELIDIIGNETIKFSRNFNQ